MPDPVVPPLVRPAGALWLLLPKWQMARHRMARHERGDLRRGLTLAVLGGAFWLASFLIAYKLVRYFRSAEDIGTLLSGKLLSMILLSFGSILLLSNTIAALSNFFLARDLDQLAAAPVSPWAVYRARLAETALHSSWMVALLLVPIIAAYGAAFEAGWGFAGVALMAIVPFLLFPAAAGSALTLLLVNVFPARRTKDLLSVITALAVAGLVILFRAARPEQLVKPEGFADFMQFVASLDTPSSPWLPSEWLSEALMRWIEREAVWPPLLRLWGAAAALVAVGGVLHARGWSRGFSQAQEGANRRSVPGAGRPWLDRALSFLGPTRRELVLKELKVFARDSTQWSQLIMLGVLLVVYVANVRYLPLNGSGMTTLLRNVIPFLNLALAGFVLASIAARFVFPSVSLEGRTWWLLRSSPLSMHDVLWAKYWVGALPLFVLALILVGVTNTMLGVLPFVQIVSLSAIAALVFPLTALALAFGTFYPRFDTENAAQIPTSFGGLLFMMSGVVLIGVVAYLTGRPAARYVVADHFGWTNDPTRMVLPFVLALTVCVVATVVPLSMARRRLEGVERE
jgi:ABC-2 type transport system permease protein